MNASKRNSIAVLIGKVVAIFAIICAIISLTITIITYIDIECNKSSVNKTVPANMDELNRFGPVIDKFIIVMKSDEVYDSTFVLLDSNDNRKFVSSKTFYSTKIEQYGSQSGR